MTTFKRRQRKEKLKLRWGKKEKEKSEIQKWHKRRQRERKRVGNASNYLSAFDFVLENGCRNEVIISSESLQHPQLINQLKNGNPLTQLTPTRSTGKWCPFGSLPSCASFAHAPALLQARRRSLLRQSSAIALESWSEIFFWALLRRPRLQQPQQPRQQCQA